MSGQLALLPAEVDDAESLVNAGCDAHGAGDLVEALRLWTAAKDIVEAAPRGSFAEEWRSVVWFNLGVGHEDLGDTKRALECYAAALRVDPSHEDAESNYDRLAHGNGPSWRSLRSYERNTERTHYCPRAEWEVVKRYPELQTGGVHEPYDEGRAHEARTGGPHGRILQAIDRRLWLERMGTGFRERAELDYARADLIHALHAARRREGR